MRFIIVFLVIFFIVKPVLSQQPSQKKIQAQINQAKAKNNNNDNNSKACEGSRWTGTLTLEEKTTSPIGISEKHVTVSFTEAFPTMYRNVETTDLTFTDDKGTGSVRYHSENTIGQKCIIDCSGGGKSELHAVVINESDSTYDIEAIGPACKGTTCEGPYGPEVYEILVSDEPLGTSKNLLSGTKSETIDIPGGLGTVTRTITWSLTKSCPPWKDSYTEKRVSTLNAKIKDPVTKFINRVNNDLCIQLRAAQGLRTKAEQDELYAQGRTKPGKIVTNARGGQSNHNSGLAIDVYLVNCDGTIDLNKRVPTGVVKIAKEEGLEWGGDWKKFKDFPHFEMK